MQIITSITSSANQRMQLVLENNETVDFHIYYSARMLAWYYDFTYKDITCNGSKVVLTPNSLRQFKKILPFGFMFSASSYIEPFKLNDFSSGRVTMSLLNADEVQQVEKEIFNND